MPPTADQFRQMKHLNIETRSNLQAIKLARFSGRCDGNLFHDVDSKVKMTGYELWRRPPVCCFSHVHLASISPKRQANDVSCRKF